jgi:hypothetical protein
MKTRTKVLFLAPVALPLILILILIAWDGYIELRWPPSRVAAALLEQAPHGTSKEAVRALIRDRRWPHGGSCGIEEQSNCLSIEVGRFETLRGRYHVFVEWYFDDRNRLTHVHVYNACLYWP